MSRGGRAKSTCPRRSTIRNKVSNFSLDPKKGVWSIVLKGCDRRSRVSADGKTVAFDREHAIWTKLLDENAEPKLVLKLDPDESAGSPPVWSGNGQELIISPGKKDIGEDPTKKIEGNPWRFKTIRVNVDGTGATDLKIPDTDGVQDWSSDGDWIVTVSSRKATLGWQLFVMRPDGRDEKRITEGGNPFYARFSPDGKRIVYTDGGSDAKRGIWVIDRDGKNRRRLLETEKQQNVSSCWSPDGTRIAVLRVDLSRTQNQIPAPRIDILDLEGDIRDNIALPENRATPDMPDWR